MTRFIDVVIRSKYYLYVSVLVLSLITPLIMTGTAVEAAPTFNNYPISSGHGSPGPMTSAGSSLWYIESASGSPYDYVGSMTTSGVVTDHSIGYPSGAAGFRLAYLATGPDGNVWFDGCTTGSGGATYAGSLNISTGAVTFYPNTVLPNCASATLGEITAGSDGNIWYVVGGYSPTNKAYLAKLDPSTGTTTIGATFAPYTNLTSLTSGPNGNLWATDPYLNRVYDVATSGSVGSYNIPTPNSAPSGITSGPDGNAWFIESSPHKIAKVTADGSFTEYTLASGVYANELAAGPDGAVWFTDVASTPKIGRITISGSVTEYTVPGGSISYAYKSIVLGPDNAMWFGESTGLGRLGY